MDLNKLFDLVQADLKKNGFVGLDYNMAVSCIIAKRTSRVVRFQEGNGTLSHDEKIEYWARKRDFGHLHVGSEDELLAHAAKEYGLMDRQALADWIAQQKAAELAKCEELKKFGRKA